MSKVSLNKNWIIKSKRVGPFNANVPCTVLSSLIENKVIDDPYFRDNELKAREYLYDNYTFTSTFNLDESDREKSVFLCFDGLCSICDIFVNNVRIAKVFDMNIQNKFLLNKKLLKEENVIVIKFKSSYKYIEKYKDKRNLFETFAVTHPRSPVIRQANYMFGWDWGPSLADMGIIKDTYLLITDVGYLNSVFPHYKFNGDLSKVSVKIDLDLCLVKKANITVSLNGFGYSNKIEKVVRKSTSVTFKIDKPRLWYPNGFGRPDVYLLLVKIDDQIHGFELGIRKIYIDDSFDECECGRDLAVYVNNKKIFLKGANYIPEDSIIPFSNSQRTEKLLNLAKEFNHNVVRVWGGGYYPSDDFYETCDRLGLLVFQDLMFACACYDIENKHFKDLVINETIDALRRIRSHPCLFMISGNNEIEDGVRGHGYLKTVQCQIMFQGLLKDIVKKETDLYYLSSSPTSGEPYYSSPNDPNYLDTHYWMVWGDNRPFEDYLTITPRLLSEFGCQSLPTYSTIERFTSEEDRKIDSKIMVHHQKDRSASNDKIIYYAKSLFKYTDNLKDLSYLSMLSQAEGIKLMVEHLRQNKNRCNGAIYWQLNDCWPAISWSSIDYYYGVKALHYYSKRFFEPSLVSFKYENEKLSINVSNDTDKQKDYTILYHYIYLDDKESEENWISMSVNAYSDKDIVEDIAKEGIGVHAILFDESHFVINENFYLYKKDKDIEYLKADVRFIKKGRNQAILTTDVFTRGIYINCHNNNIILNDNFFNLCANERKTIYFSEEVDYDNIEIICLNNIYK